jgi:methionine salvage enolase-phosphatase E1
MCYPNFQFIGDYYDTNFGAKIDQKSYTKIAHYIRATAEKILFLTDVDKGVFLLSIERMVNLPLASAFLLKNENG